MKEFQIHTEVINGEPFICIQNLIDAYEGSMGSDGSQFDFALFTLAKKLKDMKAEALKNDAHN
jgi:hypothetical protein